MWPSQHGVYGQVPQRKTRNSIAVFLIVVTLLGGWGFGTALSTLLDPSRPRDAADRRSALFPGQPSCFSPALKGRGVMYSDSWMDGVARKLDCVERENRLLRRAILAMVVGLIAVIAMI